MKESNEISVWITKNNSNKMSILPSITNNIHEVTDISSEIISKNLKKFLNNLNSILKENFNDDFEYKLDTIELNLAVNAEGGIELIGKVSAGVTASIKLILSRKKG